MKNAKKFKEKKYIQLYKIEWYNEFLDEWYEIICNCPYEDIRFHIDMDSDYYSVLRALRNDDILFFESVNKN